MKNVGDVNAQQDTQGPSVRRRITLCTSRTFASQGNANNQAIRYYCLLDSVLDDHGWRKCHAVDDYWRYEAALDAKLGYRYEYET